MIVVKYTITDVVTPLVALLAMCPNAFVVRVAVCPLISGVEGD